MKKKDEIRKSETFINYDAEGKKIIRIYSFMRKVKKNEPNVEDIVLKKLRENSKNLKEYFPTYPFRSGLQKADGFLHYSPMCEKSLIESIGGFQLPLTQAELAIIDKTVGSRKLSDIKCFLIQKCNVQDPLNWSWPDIIEALSLNSGKVLTDKEKNGGNKLKLSVESSKPLFPKDWAKIFGVHRNQIYKYEKEKIYHFTKKSERKWVLPLNELPVEYLQKYRNVSSTS